MTKKKFSLIYWILFSLPFVIAIFLFSLISLGKLGYMPTFEELENPKLNVATQIITQDTVVLDKLFLPENNRVNAEYKELSPYLVNALISTEDVRFHRHSGIDPRGLLRAVAYMGKKGGASTITQQLAKQLYHDVSNNFLGRIWQKLNEWVIAVKLEKKYTKEEIIAMYLNKFDFLNLAIGIKTASQVYFNTTTDSLKVEEAATLVGMLKNPVLFNPVRKRFADTSLYRRNTVLAQMYKYGYISADMYDSVKTVPMNVSFNRVDHNKTVGPYFREYVKRTLMAKEPKRKNYWSYNNYKEDSLEWADNSLYGWCYKNRKPNGDPYNLFKDGLKIYTTINYKMQEYAEEAVAEHLGGYLQPTFFRHMTWYNKPPYQNDIAASDYNQSMWRAIRNSERGRLMRNNGSKKEEILEAFKKPVEMRIFSWGGDKDTILSPFDSILYYKSILRSGFVAMDPHNGEVRAYVGGINFRHFKYDNAGQGKRQAGSTFKPFLYILAMQEGYTPCYEIQVLPQTFEIGDTTWTPRTTTTHVGETKTLKWGLATSENYVSAWLVKQFKAKPIANLAHKMGISSYIDPVPSMIYGTSSMSVLEMVGAYGTLANKGVHIKPSLIKRIEDRNGNVLAEFQSEQKESISEQTAYLMLNLMQGVVNYGTARRLRLTYNFDATLAGKTGTTNNNADGWYMGIAPNLIAGCWVGGEDMYIHFNKRSGLGSGSNMALPVYAEFMKRVWADSSLQVLPGDEFEAPNNFNINLDCDNSSEMIDPTDDFMMDMPDGF